MLRFWVLSFHLPFAVLAVFSSFTILELAAILLRLKARRGCWIVFSVGAQETGFLEIR